jgi:Ni/Fe-hydrogenase subunit HybB-like protein
MARHGKDKRRYGSYLSLSLFIQESLAMGRALVIVEKTEIAIPSRRIYSAHCTHPLVLFPSTPF